MRMRGALWWVVGIAAAAASAWFGRVAPIEQQWPAYDDLRTTGSVVFTVVGIWLAIIYPEVLQALSLWRQGEARQTPRVMRLFEPLRDSALMVIAVSLVALARPALSHLAPPAAMLPWIRGASYAVLAALSVIQIHAVVLALAPLLEVGRRLNEEEGLARARSSFPAPRARRRRAADRREPDEAPTRAPR